MSRQVNILRIVAVMFAVISPALLVQSQEIRTSAPDEVLQHEVFQIQYDIISSSAVSEMPKLLDYKDFELVGEPQLKRSVPSASLGYEYYALSITCNFKAKKTGTLKLPRIELTAEGHKLSSKEGNIIVRELPNMGDANCFVQVDLTKRSVRLGDTLTVTYKLYSTEEISNISSINTARIDGFYYQDLSPRKVDATEETVDGVTYKVYIIRRLLLKASELGTKEFGEGNVKVAYTYPTGRVRQDSWGRTYEEQLVETKTCTIESFEIRVHDMIAI